MEHAEVKRADTRILWREALRPRRVVLHLLFLVGVAAFTAIHWGFIAAAPVGFIFHWIVADSAAKKNRFINGRFAALWNGCRERFESFEDGIRKLHKAELAQFQELPKTVEKLAMNIYYALRRADILFEEVVESEGKDRIQPGLPHFHPTDPQAQELYRIAEKNLGEYKTNYHELMAGIQRTEAQATVFMTTIDNLRVKMLGYRLVGKSPSLNSEDFLSVLAEARVQLSAIDTALEELDLSHYPSTIAVIDQKTLQDSNPVNTVPPPLVLGEHIEVRTENQRIHDHNLPS